mgnify:CR=1 FL=1
MLSPPLVVVPFGVVVVWALLNFRDDAAWRSALVSGVATLVAFAANSVLCRLALHGEAVDPLTFTALRLASGALVLLPFLATSFQKQLIGWTTKNYKLLTRASGTLLILIGAVGIYVKLLPQL